MPSKGTTHRTVRIEDGLWKAAQEAAAERGDNLSDVIRRALTSYINERPQSEHQ
jgi:predicted HicB family RNase H-like nuclease